jgi:hypothetical protein
MSFKRKLHLGLHSKKCTFSTEKQFIQTTDEFLKNVIQSNNLPQFQKGAACLNQTKLTISLSRHADMPIAKLRHVMAHGWGVQVVTRTATRVKKDFRSADWVAIFHFGPLIVNEEYI